MEREPQTPVTPLLRRAAGAFHPGRQHVGARTRTTIAACTQQRIAARGWLITTRDSMIIQNRNEIAAVRETKAKMVALNQRDAQTKWGQLEVFMTQWRRIEALTAEPGPFIRRVSRTAMTAIALD